MEELGADKRGVKRGKCKLCQQCITYASPEGLLCTSCGHPPAQHERIDQYHLGTSSYAQIVSNNVDKRQLPSIPSNPSPHDVSGTSQTSSHYFTYQYHSYGPTLPICNAIGCSEPVKYDERFGAFEYCSPKCRDEHLLPDYNKKLQEDIDRFHAECKVSHSHTTSTLPITSSSNIRTVTIETKPKEDIGFLLSYNKGLKKVIVTGTKTEIAMEMLINAEVYLFDVITNVCGQDIKNLKDIDEIVKPKTKIILRLDGEDALNFDLTKFCHEGKCQEANRIICIDSCTGGYGFTFNAKMTVANVSKDSQAQKCGLQHGDKIKVYAAARQNELYEIMSASNNEQVSKDIEEAATSGFYLILAVYSKK